MFKDESRFCLRQLDHRVRVWRRHGEHYADCCTDRVRAFGVNNMMVWADITLTGKVRLVITKGEISRRSPATRGNPIFPQSEIELSLLR